MPTFAIASQPVRMANLGAGRPGPGAPRPSSRLSSAMSTYSTAAGTITPRGSIDGGRDTETESQYFSDAHSNFQNQSTASLGAYTPQPRAPIADSSAHGRAIASNQDDQEELQEGQRTPRGASIDESTRRLYAEEPARRVDQETPSVAEKADLAEPAAGIINRTTATQAPMVDVMKEDATIPSQTQQSATEDIRDGNQELQVPKEKMADTPPSRQSSNTAFVPGEKAAEKRESTSVDIESDKGEKSKKKKSKKGKEEKEKENPPEDDPDLAHFTPEQKKIIIDQVDMRPKGKKIGYLDIYRFSNKHELLLDAIGILAAIASGVV